MTRSKPAATLSVDLDNLWSYQKAGGIAGWEDFPSYFEIAVPRIIETFDRIGLKATIFIVGQDAAIAENGQWLRALTQAGHEIASHSFVHDIGLNRLSAGDMASDIDRAHAVITEATGVEPIGFRGPGFSLNTDILRHLASLGYAYDASTFPTFVGPLARAYYFFKSGFDRSERAERSLLFGSLKDGLRSQTPYRWDLDGMRLTELPVTTMPLVRMPFHLSYLAFAAGISPALARLYFSIALQACRIASVPPSLLLHPLDFLGADDIGTLGGFPGMGMSAAEKVALVSWVLETYDNGFNVQPLGTFVAGLKQDSLPIRRPSFDADAAVPS